MIVRTRKLSDKSLQALAKRLAQMVSDAEIHGQFAGGVSFVTTVEDLAAIPNGANERLIEKLIVKKARSTSDYIIFARGRMTAPDSQQRQPEQQRFEVREPDAYFDEIAFFEHQQRQNISGYIRFSEDEKIAVSREIGKLAAPISDAQPGEAIAIGQVLDQNLSDLQRVTTEFLERSSIARQEDEKAFRQREAQLQSEFEKKFSELERLRDDLEVRRRELNDREPQHERRRLREHLTGRLQSTITNPPLTSGRRERESNYFYLISGAVFVVISVWLAAMTNEAMNAGAAVFWASSIKSLITGVAGAAFIWAGLSGLKAAAVAGRQYEQAIQRYAFDMDRASWTVETILQMNSIEKTQVPDHWLAAVCQDLFVTGEAKRDESKSLDALAALLDVTAKARIGTNGLEFEVDRKGARKMISQRDES